MSSPHPFDTLSWLLTENSSSKKETKDVIDNSTNLNEMKVVGNDTLNYIVMDNGEIPNLYTNANFVNNFPQPEYSLVYSQNLPQILQTPSLHLYNSVHSNSIAQLQILRQKRFDSSTKTNNTLKQLPMNNISPILTTKPVIDKNNIHQNSKAVMENTVEKNQQYLTLINDRKLISHEIRKSKCTLAKLRQCTQIVKQLRRNLIELYYLSSCDTEAKNEQKNYLKTYLSHLNEPLSAIYKKPVNTMLVSFVREHFFDMHSAFKETYLTQKIPTTTTTKKTFPYSLSQDKRLRDILGIKINNNIVSSAVVAPGNGILMASVGTPYHIRNEFVDQKSCCAVQNRIDKFETAVRYIDRTLSSAQNSTSNAKQITAVISRVSSTNHQSSQSHDSRDASFDALNRRRNRTLNPKYFAGPFYSPLYAAAGGGGGNSCFSNNQIVSKKDETDYQLIAVDNNEGYGDRDTFDKDQAYAEYMPKILAKKSTNSIGKQQLKNFRGGIRMRGGPSTLNFGSRAHDFNAATNKQSHLPKNHRYGGGNNKNRPSAILTLKQKQMREQELRRKQEKLQQIRQIRRQKLVQRCWANWLLRGRSYKPLNFSIFSNSEFENDKFVNMAIPTSVYRNWMQTSFDFIGVIDYMDSREDNKKYATKMVMKENYKELENIVENEYDDPLSASDRQNLRIRIQQELTILNKLKALLDYDVIPLMPYDFTQSQLQYLSKLKELTISMTDNKKTIIADIQNPDVDDKMSALLLKHMLLTSSQINCTTESALQKSKAEKSKDLHDFENTTNQTKNDTMQTVVTNTDTIESLNKNENKSLYEKPVTSVSTKAHWNYLTEEMDWLASDFAQESRWKASAARKVSRTILRYFEDKWVRDRKTETEEIARVKRLAARVSKQIYRFWRQIAKVVENKAHYIAEARMKVELDSQLNDIVGQTERYSNLITQQFAREHIHNPSTTLKQSLEHLTYKNDKKCDKIPIKEGTTESLLHPTDKIDINTQSENIRNVFSLSQKTEVISKSNLSPTKITPKNVNDNFDSEKSKDVREEKLTIRNLDSGIMITEETNTQIQHEPTHSKRQKTQTHSKRKKRRYPSTKSDLDVNNVECATKSEETEEEKQEKMEKEELEMNQIAEEALKFQPKGFTLDTTQVKTPVPFMLKHSMREYQHIGLDWLVALWDKRLNGILADEMGLGKTIQTIALLAHLACEKGNWGPHLIIVPTSVMLNWEMECKKWCPGFRILTYYGSPKERKAKRKGWGHGLDGNNNSYETVAPNIVITSYRLVLQDERAFRRRQWQYMILDEAQNIKNFRSQRWTSLLNFKAKARLLLTGTPLQNDLMEVWSLMHFLMPTVFREASHFNTWFAKPLEKLIANVSTGALNSNNETSAIQTNTGTDIRDILGGNLHENSNHISNNLYNNSNGHNSQMYEQLITKLHKVLRPFILRRLKKQVERQLPGKFEHVLMCRLSKRQKLLYHDFLSLTTTRRTLAEGSFLGIMNILMQLRKVCNHPDLFQERPVESPFLFDIASADCVNRNHLDYTNFNNKELLCFNSRFPQLHDNVNNINQFCRPLSFLHYPTCILLNDTVDKQGFYTKWNPTLQHNSNLNDGNENNSNKIPHGEILKDKDLTFTPRTNNGFQIFSSLSTINNLTSHSKFDTTPLNDAHKNFMKINALIPYETCSNLATFFRLSNMKDLNINLNFYDKLSLQYDNQNFSNTDNKNILNYMHLNTGTIRTKEFLEVTQPYLDRFVIYTPKCMIQKPLHNLLHISHPIGHYNNNINNLSNHVLLNHEVLKKNSTMFNTTTDFYLKFPDRRLIEYDCGKLQQLKGLLAQLRHGGHRALIFTQMTRVLDILEAFLTYHGYTYLRLDGSTRVEQRQILTERFNHDMRIFCFILSTRSGGLGLNLTGADSVIFYDSDWNPTMDAQAQDRCHRIGQTKPVHIYRLISQYTVEENILHKAKQKKLLGDITIEEGNFTTAYFKREGIQAIFNTTSELSEHGTKKDGNNQNTLDRESNSDVQETLSHNSQKETIKDELLAKKQAQLFEEALAITEDDIDSLAMRRAKQEDWEGKQREYLEFDFETTSGDNNDKHETIAQNTNENTTNKLIQNTEPNETTILEKIYNERIIDPQWNKVLKLNRHWKKSIPSDLWDFISQLKPIEKYCLTLFECLNFDQLYPDDASTNTMKTTTQQLDKRELKTHTFEPHFENESNSQTPSLLPETSNQRLECTEQKLLLDVKGHKRKINHDSDESNNSAVIKYNDSNHSQANETSSDEI